MASRLNEYCLNHMFTYLKPHDLIQVSEVCQLWQRAASREWKKITVIDTLKYFRLDKETLEKVAVTITARDAGKIISHVAPFVKVLKAFDKNHNHFMFGTHCYKVEDLKVETIVRLLAQHANGITQVYFDTPPKAELVKSLIEKNPVKVLKYNDFEGYHEHIPTAGIEVLDLQFDNVNEILTSFEGYFPNLKTLKLAIEVDFDDIVEDMLIQILPHVLGLKSLILIISPKCNVEENYDMLNDIFHLSQLEELSLKVTFNVYETDAGDDFLTELRTGCPKLRVLRIYFLVDLSEKTLLSLFSLPELEIFDVVLSTGFYHMDFPEMKNLSFLKITFLCLNPDVTGFFGAVKKMPKLRSIMLDFVDEFSEANQFKLVCDVALAATSQGKEVLVTQRYYIRQNKKLRILKNVDPKTAGDSDDKCQVLHLASEFCNEETLFESVKEYLKDKLCDYYCVILEDD